ncbi:MAG: hypothetical protein QXS20_10220 [Candidatus Thorarchaeota archaeon]
MRRVAGQPERGDLYDQRMNRIGRLRQRTLPPHELTQLEDADSTLVCVIDRRSSITGPVYEVRWPDGSMVAQARPVEASARGMVRVTQPDGEIICTAIMSAVSHRATIATAGKDGKTCACLSWPLMSPGGPAASLDTVDEMRVRIVDPSADRLVILACSVIVDELYASGGELKYSPE